MINLKWSGIAGGGAFVVSLLVGLISGAGFPLLLIRAVIFGALFFVLAGGVWMLINNFIPELLFPGEDETGALSEDGSSPGSRVDISVDDGQNLAVPEKYGFSGADNEVGNISDLLSGKNPPENTSGMDQKGEDGYTKIRGTDFQTEGTASNSGVPGSPATGAYDDSVEILPDLDSMAADFIPPSTEPAEMPADHAAPARTPSGNKPQSLKGDFNPKELAAAIRTTIHKE